MVKIPEIPPPDLATQQAARDRQTTLLKPPGALGDLETLAARIAGMTGRWDWLPERRAIIVCAGDHGVVAQGVSTVPASITAYMVGQFLNGTAAINVLARQMDARLLVVDAGVAADLPEHPQLVNGKIVPGTADFTLGPAMTAEHAEQSIQLGLDVAEGEIKHGLNLLAVGEMGIGNTTAASAIIAAMTNRPVVDVTGRGTGLDDERLRKKIAVIETALRVNQATDEDVLAKVGGFEIGAMAGLMLGAAANRVPVLIDGLICTAAALIAAKLRPEVCNYLIAGHQSAEPGHRIALEHLALKPLLQLNMRLGEGTGAVLAMPIVEAAMRTLQEMAVLE